MTFVEKFRTMSDEDQAGVLWWYSINVLTGFLENGGAGCMDFLQLKDWISSEYDPNSKYITGPDDAVSATYRMTDKEIIELTQDGLFGALEYEVPVAAYEYRGQQYTLNVTIDLYEDELPRVAFSVSTEEENPILKGSADTDLLRNRRIDRKSDSVEDITASIKKEIDDMKEDLPSMINEYLENGEVITE